MGLRPKPHAVACGDPDAPRRHREARIVARLSMGLRPKPHAVACGDPDAPRRHCFSARRALSRWRRFAPNPTRWLAGTPMPRAATARRALSALSMGLRPKPHAVACGDPDAPRRHREARIVARLSMGLCPKPHAVACGDPELVEAHAALADEVNLLVFRRTPRAGSTPRAANRSPRGVSRCPLLVRRKRRPRQRRGPPARQDAARVVPQPSDRVRSDSCPAVWRCHLLRREIVHTITPLGLVGSHGECAGLRSGEKFPAGRERSSPTLLQKWVEK